MIKIKPVNLPPLIIDLQFWYWINIINHPKKKKRYVKKEIKLCIFLVKSELHILNKSKNITFHLLFLKE